MYFIEINMKEKKIILKIYNDLPMSLVSQLMTTLPKSGVNIYDTSSGEVVVAKVDYRKNDTYQIYKANGSKEF